MKLKILCFVLTICMLIPCVIACKKQEGNDDGTDNVTVTDSETETKKEDKDDETVLELVREGEFQYTIIYDETDKYMSMQLMLFVDYWADTYGVRIPCFPKRGSEADYGREIIVGNVRDAAAGVAEKVDPANDFAIYAVEDDLVLYASQSKMYAYLFGYMRKNVLTRGDADKNLRFSSKNNYIYSEDEMLNKVNYVRYMYGNNVSYEVLLDIFDPKSFTASDGTTLPYRIYVPYDYDPSKKYPVLTILHGAGERGDDNKKQLKNGVSHLFSQENADILNAIVIAPQCPAGNQWVDTPWASGSYSVRSVAESNELKAVVELLDSIENSYSTDTNRYYVAGLSMGGFGTWDLLMRHPERFAAGLAMCGGADPSMARKLKDMPIYTVHGDADPTVPVSGTREMVEALKNAGSSVIVYEELQNYKHNIWDYTCSKPEIQKWLFEQTRAGRADVDIDDEAPPSIDGINGSVGDDSEYTKNY